MKIPVTKYIAWKSSFIPGPGPVVMTREEAIYSQHVYAAVRRLPPYPDDDAALVAFMADRSAWTTDRADGRMDDEPDEADDEGSRLRARVELLRVRVERLESALRKYGGHLPDCRVVRDPCGCGCECGRCDCGWSALLDEGGTDV